jgi:hypothetical protein
MKNVDFDKIWIGILLGFIAPLITMFIFYLIYYRSMKIEWFIYYLRSGDTPVIRLCVLANLIAFYPFIWKEKWKAARGVLGSTFIWVAIVLFLIFFT